MGSLGGIVSSPAANAFMTMLSTAAYNKPNYQYNADIDRQYADALAEAEAISRGGLGMFGEDYGAGLSSLGTARDRSQAGARRIAEQAAQLYGTRAGHVMGGIDRGAQDLTGRYDTNFQKLLQQSNQGYSGLEGRYKTREADILGQLEGLGAQERKDIERAFADLEAQQLGALNERGLAGSTVVGSVQGGLRERKGDELSRLNERLQNQRMNAMAGLSADTLGAAERGQQTGTQLGLDYQTNRLGADQALAASRAAYDASLSGDTAAARLGAMNNALNTQWMTDAAVADAQRDYANRRAGMYMDTTGQHLGVLTGMERMPPTPPSYLASQFGANSVQGPQAPTSLFANAGPIGAGIGLLGGLALAPFVPGANIPLSMLASGAASGGIGYGLQSAFGR